MLLSSMWHPNRQQWLVILISAAVAIPSVLFAPKYGAFFFTAAILIGGLLLWSMQVDRK